MKPISTLVMACLVAYSTISYAGDPWLDEVILFDQPEGSSNDGFAVETALGEAGTESDYVSIDVPETAIFAFTDNIVVNGDGNDLKLYEIVNGDSDIEVYVSPDNINYTFLGITNRNEEFDLSDVGLSFIRFVKIVGLENGGADSGYDLDAIEALHTEDRDPTDPVVCEQNTQTCAQNPATSNWALFSYRCDVPSNWSVSQTGGSECSTDVPDNPGMCSNATFSDGVLHIPTVDVTLNDPFGGTIIFQYEVDMQLVPNSTSLLFELTNATQK